MPEKIGSVNPFCVPCLGSSQAVITRDLVNGGNMQCDRRFSSCGCSACHAESPAQPSSAEQPLLPSLSLPALPSQAPGSPCALQRAQDTWHTDTCCCQRLQPSLQQGLASKDPVFHYFMWSACLKHSTPTDHKPTATWDLLHFIFITTDIYI